MARTPSRLFLTRRPTFRCRRLVAVALRAIAGGTRISHLRPHGSRRRIGFAISVGTLNVPARYAASFLYASGAFAARMPWWYSWAASVLNETPEKRAAATAIVNLLSQFGNIWSPYFFRPEDQPRYLLAMVLMMVFSVLSILCCFVFESQCRDGRTRSCWNKARPPARETLCML